MFRFILPGFFVGFLVLSCIFIFHIFVFEITVSRLEQSKPILNQSQLQSDLSVTYFCPSNNNSTSDNLEIDLFLKQKGFDVRDDSMSELAPTPLIMAPQDINAIDSQRRSISFDQTNQSGKNHHIWLTSEPPTIHDVALEQDILSLVSEKLKCNITNVQRQSNAKDVKQLYDFIFQQHLWEYSTSTKPQKN
jgi:hypothetical protein